MLYLYLAADIYGKTVKNQIIENPTTEIKYVDNEIIRGIVIGKTKEILFLLEDGTVKAIPITSLVKEFEIK